MKINGAELAQFISEAWPSDDYYWDHDLDNQMLEDGSPDPSKTYAVEDLGPLLWQGNSNEDPTSGIGLSLAGLIRRWRKERDTKVVTIRVPNSVHNKDIRAALKPLKGSIE